MLENVLLVLILPGIALALVHWLLRALLWWRGRGLADGEVPGFWLGAVEVDGARGAPRRGPHAFPLERMRVPLAVGLACFVVSVTVQGNLGVQGFQDWYESVVSLGVVCLGYVAAQRWLAPFLPARSAFAPVLLMVVVGLLAGGVQEFLVPTPP